MSTIERNSNPNSSLRLIYPLSRRKADALPHVAVAPTLKQAALNARSELGLLGSVVGGYAKVS